MHRFKKILLIDTGAPGRKRAFGVAHALAERNGGSLTVLAIVEDAPPAVARVLGLGHRTELSREGLAAAREETARLGEGADLRGVPTAFDAAAGIPFIEINQRVLRDGHDLVMIAAEGRDGSWWGSTAAHLLRKCPVPVWVLRPEPAQRYERVLVAVDPEDEQPTAQDLARKLLQMSSSLARLNDAELHIVSAWNVYGENLLRSRLGYDAEALERVREETRADHEAHLKTLLGELGDSAPEPRIHLEQGQAAEQIARVAREVDASILVLGTVGRTGISGLLIGNTAEDVLARVECPIIAVKPEGFVSPVKVE
jgi:nucleotide-binding universal stress UspA family protein